MSNLPAMLKKEEIENITIALDRLDPSVKEQIMARVNALDVTDSNAVGDYGIESSKRLSEYTHSILQSTKLKDAPEVENLMLELVGELSKVDTENLREKKQGLLSRLFRKEDVKSLITRYESVDGVIQGIADKLEKAQFELKKDIKHCDNFGNNVVQHVKDLDEDIVVLRVKLEEIRKSIHDAELQLDPSDQVAVYELDELKAIEERIDKRCYDLMLVRQSSILLLPQIRMIKKGNEMLVDKIKTSITTAIPMWEAQISLALQIDRQKTASSVQKAVTDITNDLIKKNSELLKDGTVQLAKESERGVIDPETLKVSTDNLIKTLMEVKTIQQQGAEKRKQITQEMAKMQIDLNNSYLQIENKK